MAPLHGTFYVQRPLPARFTEGYTLTADDVLDLKRLLVRRDRWIELYQNMELSKNRDLAESAAYSELLERRTHVPVTGYVLKQGESDTLRFHAPKQPGKYPYICSFPGHYLVMRGVMVVE